MQQELMLTKKNASVVIVGAGPTGLTAGNLLGIAGIDTVILERNAGLPEGYRI
jgi:3-(3-hydroxy-phenyl)propionate hydroxylase